MNVTVLLDAGPLGMISNPKATAANIECYEWMEAMIVSGAQVFVPEIADYEVRRELLRASKFQGIARLDLIKNTIGYLPAAQASLVWFPQCYVRGPVNRGVRPANP